MIPQILHNIKRDKPILTDPHQIEAYEHLVANPRAALFLGMSLSKTVTVLSYLYDMHYQECAMLKTLVVAPDKVARITWPDEIATWGHLQGMRYSVIAGDAKKREAALAADAEIYIIGVDNLAWLIDKFIYQKISSVTGEPYGPWLGKLPFDSLVLDEMSLFKGRDSERFKKLRRALIKSDVHYRIGMTGTPAPNGFIDLWAPMVLLDDGVRLGVTFGDFLDKYFTTRGNGMIVYEYIPKRDARSDIARKIRDIALTMSTRDKIKLPDMYTDDIMIDLDEFDQEVYDTLEREYVLEFLDGEGDVTVKTAADLTNKLLQISSGAIYADKAEGEKTRTWNQVNTAKLDAMEALLNRHPNDTFLCVYQFRHEIERIRERFPFARELRKGKATIEDFREWNEGKIRLLLIHPAGAGHGLNLQFGGFRQLWFTPTWNLEHYQQTVARLLRRGAKRDIFIHRLIVRGSRDERVTRRLSGKQSMQEFLFTEIKELRKKHGKK